MVRRRGVQAVRLEQIGTMGRALRLAELRSALGVSQGFLMKCIQSGTLKTGRVGSHHRVSEAEAVRFARDELRLLE